MIGAIARFLRSWIEDSLPEPSMARRRLLSFSRGQLCALLSSAHYPISDPIPGLWSATTDGLRGVALRLYERGEISDEQIEDIT